MVTVASIIILVIGNADMHVLGGISVYKIMLDLDRQESHSVALCLMYGSQQKSRDKCHRKPC